MATAPFGEFSTIHKIIYMYKSDFLVENRIAHCVGWLNTAAAAVSIWWCA